MIKAVIFDIGGVTIKLPMPHVYKSIGKKFKIKWSECKEIDESLDSLIETKKITLKKYWTILSGKLRIEDVGSFKKTYTKAFIEAAVLNLKVVKLIKRLKEKKYVVAALSNTMTLHEKILREKGYYKFFSPVILSIKLGIRKPNIRIYRYATKKLNLKSSECVFIDDKKVNVISAKKAGMKAILFKNATQLEKDLTKYL